MIAGALFVAIGFACGLFLRFAGFAVVTTVTIVAYAIATVAAGIAGLALALAILIALIALQVGYFTAAVCRIAVNRWRAGTDTAKNSATPNEFQERRPPLSACGFGKPFHRPAVLSDAIRRDDCANKLR
jgi:hypothetical protein